MREIPKLPPLPDPSRNKEQLVRYTQEVGGEKMSIIMNDVNSYPEELQNFLLTLDPWNIPAESISEVFKTGNRSVTIIKTDEALLTHGRAVLKNIGNQETRKFGSRRRNIDYDLTVFPLSKLIELSNNSDLEKQVMYKELITNLIFQTAGRLSLIHQLTIGDTLSREYKKKFGKELLIEKALGGYVNIKGEKIIIYEYYPGLTYRSLSDSKKNEYTIFVNLLTDQLFDLGYRIIDLQFLVCDETKPIDLNNIVLIDTEYLVPTILLESELEKSRKNLKHSILEWF